MPSMSYGLNYTFNIYKFNSIETKSSLIELIFIYLGLLNRKCKRLVIHFNVYKILVFVRIERNEIIIRSIGLN